MRVRPSRLLSLSAASLTIFLSAPALCAADLTAAIWAVKGVDVRGVTWDSSTLRFLSQLPVGNDYALTGYFYWTSDDGAFGRENFVGTLFEDRHIDLTGTEIVPPSNRIGLGQYLAELAPSGTEIVNGTWTVDSTFDGVWSATVVPEPSAAALMGAGTILLAFVAKRKRGA